MQIDLNAIAIRAGVPPAELSRRLFPDQKDNTRATYMHYLKTGDRPQLLTPERIVIVSEVCKIPPYIIFDLTKNEYLSRLNQAIETRSAEIETINKLKKLSQ